MFPYKSGKIYKNVFTIYSENFARGFFFALFSIWSECKFKTRITLQNLRVGSNSRLSQIVSDIYMAKIRLGKFKAEFIFQTLFANIVANRNEMVE